MRSILIVIAVIAVISITYVLFNGHYLTQTESVSGAQSIKDPSYVSGNSIKDSADNNGTLIEEATGYVSNLTDDKDKNVEIKSADDFISGKQVLSFDDSYQTESINIGDLLANDSLSGESPITVIREQQQIEIVSLSTLIKQAKGDLNKTISVLENGAIKEITLSDLINKYNNNLHQQIEVIQHTEHLEITTKNSLLNDPNLDKTRPLKIIKKPYRLHSTTIDELLMGENIADNNVYYVRNVNKDDKQGIWGIVHNGLVRNFASGIAIKRGERIEKYQVEIPHDADERKSDNSSSFLGRMIERKTSESYVYNYNEGKMGKNPDLVYPGQEIVIISFTPEELIQIYQHFVIRSQS